MQGTINGYGERCGNSNLNSIIANLKLKMDIDCVTDEQLARLSEVAHFVAELANLQLPAHTPYVGNSAFAHKGGTHVNAVVKLERSYQHIDPVLVGNRKRVVVSELSGKDNIAVKSEEYGLNGINREQERAVLQQIKELENHGYSFEASEASVDLLLRRAQPDYQKPFELIDFTTAVDNRRGRGLFSEATVKVDIEGHIFHEVAEGNGPVNALNLALRKALERFYPDLKSVHLVRLQGAYPGYPHGHGGHHPGADRLQRRPRHLEYRRRQRQHYRSQLAGAVRRTGVCVDRLEPNRRRCGTIEAACTGRAAYLKAELRR